MGRFALYQGPIAIPGVIALTQLTNHADASVWVSEVNLQVDVGGTHDQVVVVELGTYTADGVGGTSSGLLVSRDNGTLDGWAGSYQVYDGTWGTAPAGFVRVKSFRANFAPGFHVWQPKPASEQRFNAGVGVRFGLKVTVAPDASINLGSEMDFYEG